MNGPVTYLSTSEEIVARELGAFQGIAHNDPKYVLSSDEFDFSRDGYVHQNVREFLKESGIFQYIL